MIVIETGTCDVSHGAGPLPQLLIDLAKDSVRLTSISSKIYTFVLASYFVI